MGDWDEPPVHDEDKLYDIVEVLVEIGEAHGVSAAQVTLAWLLTRPGVSTLVIAARTEEQLTDNLAAADLALTDDELARIEEVSRPNLRTRTGTRPPTRPTGSAPPTRPPSRHGCRPIATSRIGQSPFMPEYSATIETPLTIEEAFRYMADFSHTSEWDPNCEVAEQTTDGKIGVGTGFHLEFSGVAGKTMELDYEVKEFDEPHRFVLEADNGTIHSIDTVEVESAPAGSKVTYTAQLELTGAKSLANPILGLALSKAGSDARKGLEEKLNGQTVSG